MGQDGKNSGSETRGIALITTLLLVMVAGALITGAVAVGANHLLVDRFWNRQSRLVGLAEAGVEEGLATLNGRRSLFPDTGFTVLESGAPVTDGRGGTIPGVQRWLYAGPVGITSGQYGVFGSVVAVVRDQGGGVAIRRLEIYQESFAKFAYFTDYEGGNIYFASNDHIWGPLHTNDQIKIHSSRANFHGEVTTAKDISGKQYGTFDKGFTEHAPAIPMPETADLMKLKALAAAGGTAFTGSTVGGDGEATLRIEFVAVDLNGDGDRTDEDEGFFRVYRSSDAAWVVAKAPSTFSNSLNCGDYHGSTFVAAGNHNTSLHGHSGTTALNSSSRVCYLGGDDRLWGGFVANDGKGQWLPWTGTVDPRLAALRADAAYLFPLARSLNPNFKGVIFVEGKVAVSGQIRGHVTVAATSNIIIADDITYVTDPGAGTCADIAGYFSGAKVVMSNNTLNSPWRTSSSASYLTRDDSPAEFVHGVVLALDVFTAEDFNSGATSAQPCEGTSVGRGCLYLTGGIIQRTRGAVGLTSGEGYAKRYSYDKCAASQPPPYFPTTGVFVKGQLFPVDPAGFSIQDYFRLLTAGGAG